MRAARSKKILQGVSDTILNRQLFKQTDKLLVGISGGKDSLALLDILHQLGYNNLFSIHVRIDKSAPLPFVAFCRERSDFTVIETDILSQVQSSKRKNTCYMCSRAKRKALSTYAVEHGFTKLALAHHKDDAIETLLLNLIFQREISTMLPNQELFKGNLELVRPLYDTNERDLARYSKLNNLPVSDWDCGHTSDNNRAWVKAQIKLWQKAHPKLKVAENIYRAMLNVNPDWLPQKLTDKKA